MAQPHTCKADKRTWDHHPRLSTLPLQPFLSIIKNTSNLFTNLYRASYRSEITSDSIVRRLCAFCSKCKRASLPKLSPHNFSLAIIILALLPSNKFTPDTLHPLLHSPVSSIYSYLLIHVWEQRLDSLDTTPVTITTICWRRLWRLLRRYGGLRARMCHQGREYSYSNYCEYSKEGFIFSRSRK